MENCAASALRSLTYGENTGKALILKIVAAGSDRDSRLTNSRNALPRDLSSDFSITLQLLEPHFSAYRNSSEEYRRRIASVPSNPTQTCHAPRVNQEGNAASRLSLNSAAACAPSGPRMSKELGVSGDLQTIAWKCTMESTDENALT